MKNVIFIFAMLLLQVGVVAQDSNSDVPVNIQKAFKAKYASAEYVDWMAGETYVATFWQGDLYLEATFNKAGQWVETSTVLEEAALPQSVISGINKAIGENYITYVVKMDTNGAASTYVVDVSTETDSFQVTTDMNGNVLKKEVMEYEEDEEDDGF